MEKEKWKAKYKNDFKIKYFGLLETQKSSLHPLMLKGLSVSNFSVQILMIDDTYQFSKVTTDCIERIAKNHCFL